MPTTPFLNLFGRSPVRPLEAHMSKVGLCVAALRPFFDAVFRDDWVTADAARETIVQLENDADALKRDLRLHLPKGLFLPVSRSDLLSLLNVQDRLANCAKDIAGIVLGRRMSFPPTTVQPFREFLSHCLDASQMADKAIHELDELFETGFSGSEIKVVEKMIEQLSRIEHETDSQQILLRQMLFGLESTLPPVDVMFLYHILEKTGELADRAQEIGNRLQILLAR